MADIEDPTKEIELEDTEASLSELVSEFDFSDFTVNPVSECSYVYIEWLETMIVITQWSVEPWYAVIQALPHTPHTWLSTWNVLGNSVNFSMYISLYLTYI